jgi:hypothetical protein
MGSAYRYKFEAMSDTIIGAIIGAMATLLATLPVWRGEHRRRRDAQSEVRERELNALRAVINVSHDIGFLVDPSVVAYPEHSYKRIGDLRDTILQAQGALPMDSQAQPVLKDMQGIAGELRQDYRMLERPIGQRDPVVVTPEAFRPYVQAFRDRFSPLLADLENHVKPAAQDHILPAWLTPWNKGRDPLL